MDIHILVLLLLLPLIAKTTQQPAKASSNEDLMLPPDFPDFDDNQKDDLTAAATNSGEGQQFRFIENLISSDLVLSKLEPIAELLDFKFRTVKFIGSLMTRDNFYLLRRFLLYLTKVSNFIATFMPSQPQGPGVMQSFFGEDTETPLEEKRQAKRSSDADSVHKRSADDQKEINLEMVGSYLQNLEKWRKILDEK